MFWFVGKCEGGEEAGLHFQVVFQFQFNYCYYYVWFVGECEGGEEAGLNFQVTCLFLYWGGHQWLAYHQSLQVGLDLQGCLAHDLCAPLLGK